MTYLAYTVTKRLGHTCSVVGRAWIARAKPKGFAAKAKAAKSPGPYCLYKALLEVELERYSSESLSLTSYVSRSTVVCK
jgi:hypothetical protein